MNKTIILSLTSVLIFSCLALNQILSTLAFQRRTRFSATGIIVKPVENVEPTKMKRHLVAYALNPPSPDETIQQMAQFDLVIISSHANSEVSRIKALNPNTIVIAYKTINGMHTYYDDWAEVDAHEDWFLHDIYGNRIKPARGGLAPWYGMDVGNPGWRNHYADYVKGMLEAYPDLDGIFADNVWDFFRYDVWNVEKEQLPAGIGSRWHSDMLEMIKYVKSEMGNKLFIINTENNYDYVEACDGKMEEMFVHTHFWNLDEFPQWYEWKTKIESLKYNSQRGKYYLAHSGTIVPEDHTTANLQRVHEMMIYCFAFSLLGWNGENATFGFNKLSSKYGSRFCYCSEFNVSLGSPTSDYYQIGPVYTRDFESGKVLVNPARSSHTVQLSGEYVTPSDDHTIILSPHSGAILLKE